MLSVPIVSVGVERLFSIASRLYRRKVYWSYNTFRAIVLLYKFNRRRQADAETSDDYLFVEDLDNPSISKDDREWEESIRNEEL